MFSTMTKTYKIGKLVENVLDKINKSDDFNVELNVVDDNTVTVTIKKTGIATKEETQPTIIVRR